MSKSIAVPSCSELAARDHISVDAFVSALLAKRLADRGYIDGKAELFNKEDFERALNEIPDVEPEDRNRL